MLQFQALAPLSLITVQSRNSMVAHPGSGAALRAPHPLLILAACINGCALDGNLVRQNTASSTEWVTNSTVLRSRSQILSRSFCSRVRMRVQRAERLVHQEHFGVIGQRARQRDALLHASRQFLGIKMLKAFQADHLDQRAALRFGFVVT